MKRIEYLLNDVRLHSDNKDINGILDREIIQYFNDGIKLIQATVFKNDPLCTHFIVTSDVFSAAEDEEIDLPTDCYADSAISSVLASEDGGHWHPLERIWEEDHNSLGFKIEGKKLILSFDVNYVKIKYFKRLPRFDKRWASIASKVGSVLNLSGATDTDLSLVNDTISVVDADGVIVQGNIKTSSYSLPTSLTSSTTLLGSVAAGQFIVSGGYSTTICDLPEECETLLMDYVKLRLLTRNNYTDAIKQQAFSEEQKQIIADIFARNAKDRTAPPITDTDYLWV